MKSLLLELWGEKTLILWASQYQHNQANANNTPTAQKIGLNDI